MFTLFNVLFAFLIIFVGTLIGQIIGVGELALFLYILYFIAIIIPSLSVLVRRLHDTGNSGWMYFISLIPLIGIIWLFILLVSNSQSVENKWGLNPKEK
tara:strand:- start:87 stop:383 length:297 start_codon:yes stop_codon:yes gene_type:complete